MPDIACRSASPIVSLVRCHLPPKLRGCVICAGAEGHRDSHDGPRQRPRSAARADARLASHRAQPSEPAHLLEGGVSPPARHLRPHRPLDALLRARIAARRAVGRVGRARRPDRRGLHGRARPALRRRSRRPRRGGGGGDSGGGAHASTSALPAAQAAAGHRRHLRGRALLVRTDLLLARTQRLARTPDAAAAARAAAAAADARVQRDAG